MRVARIKWVDSANHRYGWNDKILNTNYTEIDTIGFVVYEDKYKVIVSHSYSDNMGLWYDSFTIPRVAITKFEYIDEKKQVGPRSISKA